MATKRKTSAAAAARARPARSMPAASIDRRKSIINEAAKLFAVIHDLRSRGVSILYISHRLGEVKALADRVTVLHYGEVIAEGTPAEIRANRTVQEIYLGED